MGRALNISSRSVTAKHNPRSSVKGDVGLHRAMVKAKRVLKRGRKMLSQGEAMRAQHSRSPTFDELQERGIAAAQRWHSLHRNPQAIFYTITSADVGKRTIRAFGKRRSTVDFLGQVQAQDVGKRVYNMGEGVLQVENNAQRDARLRRNPAKRGVHINEKALRNAQARAYRGNPKKRRFKSYGDTKAVVTTLAGKHVADFYSQKEAIAFARAYAKKHRIGLRVVDPR